MSRNTGFPRAFSVSALLVVTSLVGLDGAWQIEASEANELRVATFVADVTPPLGHPLCGGWIKPVEVVDDPLLAKGVILDHADRRYVLCSVDWCLLQTGAYDLLRRQLAEAADAPLTQVSVHTVHQHNAPIADLRAQQLLDGIPGAPRHLDTAFMAAAADRVAAAVRAARGRLQPVTHIGRGRARVEGFASNRRVRLADGEIHVRYSATKDPALQAAPEGLIDPWLRTVSLFAGERPLVRLHYYATHPMSFYGDGRVTSDTVGLARERLEREEAVPQIYFTGCAGNITGGKYNDGSPEARARLTDRIYAAMKESANATRTEPFSTLDWATAEVLFAGRTEPEWSEATARTTLAATNVTDLQRLKAALDLAWIERLRASPAVEISRLRLGAVTLLHLPGEAFIEYQLYAQSLRPDDFVAVAAYGESGPGYICCDAALREGGYEPTMSRVGPPSEVRLKQAIAAVVGVDPAAAGPPFYPDKLRLLTWRDPSGLEQPVTNPEGWARRREHMIQAMVQVMGPTPGGKAKRAVQVEEVEVTEYPKYVQRRITFLTPDGDAVPALLLVPKSPSGRLAAMLCLHQTTPEGKAEPAGLSGNAQLHYARELAERGFVAMAPDYPNFGGYKTDPYAYGYSSATMKGIVNHRAAVDVLQSLPEVDPERIGVIGHSLGGHNALFVAAFEPRLKAVVTSCGFNSFFRYMKGDLTGWSHAGYMPRIAAAYGRDPKQMPFDFTEVLAALAPRPVFINAPMNDDNFEVSGVKDCVLAATPVYGLWQAESRLVARYPHCRHEFPDGTREEAYRWLEQVLPAP